MARPACRATRRLRGTPASAGVARGRLHFVEDPEGEAMAAPAHAGDAREQLQAALNAAAAGVALILDGLEDDDEATGMLQFQLAMIEDDTLRDAALARIDGGEPAHVAWRAVLDAEVEDYAAASDAYFRGRAADLRDIRNRVLRTLLGQDEIPIPPGSIAIADDLPPSRFLGTSWGQGGIALTGGAVTSHVAMLARARGIPMVIGLEAAPDAVDDEVFLDADAGELIIDARAREQAELIRRRKLADGRRRSEERFLHTPAVTPDGDRVAVQINVADPDELEGIDPGNCDGIGLVRTEFLFHRSATLPGEDEQLAVYRRIVAWAAGKPVTIRTLDAGGDKPIPGITVQGELNPFLGVRGIRLSLLHPGMFRVQLRAMLRASAYGALKIMLPMVTSPDELAGARVLLEEEKDALAAAGVATGDPPLGMMVEVPAAAISIADFDADFFSIGSNDLVQYVTASSRDSDRLLHLARADNPAVLSLVQQVIRHGRDTSRDVSLCGEMAGDPRYIGLLLERGLRTFSVAPAALAATKAAICGAGAR